MIEFDTQKSFDYTFIRHFFLDSVSKWLPRLLWPLGHNPLTSKLAISSLSVGCRKNKTVNITQVTPIHMASNEWMFDNWTLIGGIGYIWIYNDERILLHHKLNCGLRFIWNLKLLRALSEMACARKSKQSNVQIDEARLYDHSLMFAQCTIHT